MTTPGSRVERSVTKLVLQRDIHNLNVRSASYSQSHSLRQSIVSFHLEGLQQPLHYHHDKFEQIPQSSLHCGSYLYIDFTVTHS